MQKTSFSNIKLYNPETEDEMSKNPVNFDKAIDKGLEGVTVCSTGISSIHKSTLYLRGWPLEELAKKSSYSEVSYLLWRDKLPNKTELKNWEELVCKSSTLSREEKEILKSLPYKNVHPMAWLRTAVSACSLLEKEPDVTCQEDLEDLGVKLLAKTPLFISFFHALRQGREFPEPKKTKGLAWNFLYTLNGGKEPSDDFVKMLDICLILHADHGLNCSTFTARVTSSSLSDMVSALVSAIGSLKGPLHGGANEQVMKMLHKLPSKKQALDFVDKAFATRQKIMGFGHRIYKVSDPRAEILKSFSKKLTKETGQPELYEISEAMEEKIRKEKGLPPNVDFYSASVYHCLGIPYDLFTPIFAMSRMSGWIAHILEQYSNNRIYRPLSRWLNTIDREWKNLEDR